MKKIIMITALAAVLAVPTKSVAVDNNTVYHNLNIIPTFFKGSHYKVVA